MFLAPVFLRLKLIPTILFFGALDQALDEIAPATALSQAMHRVICGVIAQGISALAATLNPPDQAFLSKFELPLGQCAHPAGRKIIF